jgi:hypothetical protein
MRSYGIGGLLILKDLSMISVIRQRSMYYNTFRTNLMVINTRCIHNVVAILLLLIFKPG